MDNKSVSQAMVACFIAMGQALGEDRLTEAEKHLRALINDGGIERGAARILQSIIAGINYRPSAPLHS
jgi:hypothetical protein